jgi:hypothetical protein
MSSMVSGEDVLEGLAEEVPSESKLKLHLGYRDWLLLLHLNSILRHLVDTYQIAACLASCKICLADLHFARRLSLPAFQCPISCCLAGTGHTLTRRPTHGGLIYIP